MQNKKDRSPYSSRRKQSLDHLATVRALVRVLMTQEIMRNSDAHCNTKESP